MKKHKPNIYDIDLDSEEQDIVTAIDQAIDENKLKSVKNLKEELAIAKQAAANSLRKDKRINIRISNSDLMRLKQKAAYEGLPYQTFIASILHKYAAGHI